MHDGGNSRIYRGLCDDFERTSTRGEYIRIMLKAKFIDSLQAARELRGGYIFGRFMTIFGEPVLMDGGSSRH